MERHGAKHRHRTSRGPWYLERDPVAVSTRFKELTMKKLNETQKARLKLSREAIVLLSTTRLGDVQGGGTFVTKGVGCEPSGIRPCE
jgi:hypothetical protein